ncbi:NAD(P)-binding protein, partial [Aureobasidium melanogenum]
MSLNGRIAIVTGGARGIGAAIVLALASEGAKVAFNYVSDNSAPKAEDLVKAIHSNGGDAVCVQADMADASAPSKIVETTLQAFATNRIDILVNNAGLGQNTPLQDVTPEEYEKLMNVNVRAVIFMTQKVLPYLKGSSNRIINLSSISARGGYATQTVYAATKAAVEGFTRVWAKELGHTHKVTVNAVNPGPVDTDMYRAAGEVHLARMEEQNKAVPAAPRCGTGQDVADIITFLRVKSYEDLVNNIKRAWSIHVPSVTLEDALAALDDQRPERTNSQSVSHSSSSVNAALHTEMPDSQSVSCPDSAQSDPGDYEFDESHDFDELIDGMGFLTAEPCRSGYTGPTSGVAALRLLRSLPTETYAAEEPVSGHLGQSPSIDASMAEFVDVDALINDYFLLYHPAYPLLHEGLFRARALGAVPKPRDGSWDLLYNMVIAIGAFAGGLADTNIDLKYYNIAKNSISLSLLEKGSICYVQGLSLMANYLQKRNKPNAGFAMIGIAWSMALSIGLHREFDNPSTSAYNMEIRRRAWWTLFVFVSGHQLTFGRPPASLVGINLRHPTNLDDKDLAVDMFALPDDRDSPTTASALIAQIKLASIGNVVQSELLTHQVPALETAQHLDQQITTWLAELPRYYDPKITLSLRFEIAKRVLIWRSYHLRIVLFRPFLFRAVTKNARISSDDKGIWTCIETADTCVDSVHCAIMNDIECRRGFAWYATYWLLTASVVHATCLAYAPYHASRDRWRSKLELAIDALDRLRRAQAMADQAQKVLSRLLERYCSSSSDQTVTPANQSNDQWQNGSEVNPVGTVSDPQQAQNMQEMLDPVSMTENMVVPDTTADLLWLWSQSADTDFLDAAGNFMLQNNQHTWSGS